MFIQHHETPSKARSALGKLCTLQWIPAHIDIEGNEMADSLANETRPLEPLTLSTTVFDANAVANKSSAQTQEKNYRCQN
ncbi:hypothetical protein TNCV_1259411 [Trichonephila clavipes]|nr:hypothetical protein TNCV_1259411 [Trichonephila clavipes]